MEILNFIFLMVRIVLPIVNSVVFFELFLKNKKPIYFWTFIVFITLFIGNSLWLVALLFPQHIYLGLLGYAFSAPVEYIKEFCTLIRFFAYFRFGQTLYGKSMTNIEKIIWCAITTLVMTTVFINDVHWSSVRNYGVLMINTVLLWVIMVSGTWNIIKHQSKFRKLDFYSLILIYCSTLVCYFFSLILLIVNKIGLHLPGSGAWIIAANLIVSITGIVWVILNARRNEQNQQAVEKKVENMAQDIPKVTSMEVLSQYPSIQELQLKYELTDRESEILGLMLDGKTNEEIGKILFIALGTVKSHTHNIFIKMNISRRSQLLSIIDIYSLKDRSVNM